MAKHRTSPDATPIFQLLSDYSFDVESNGTEAMVAEWLQQFEPTWVSQAITEALYQGRYKVVSVDHILQFWQRRGQPLRHFNREFESIILGQSFNQMPSPAKVSPAPLNFSQSQDSEQPTPAEPASAAPVETGSTSVSAPPVAPITTPDPPPAAPEITLAATSETTSDAIPEAPLPPATWPASRSIPPLTPDQLARLTDPVIPTSPTPATEISDEEESGARLAPAPTPVAASRSPIPSASTAATGAPAAASTIAEPQALPLQEGTPQPHPGTIPEPALKPGSIPNFQPIAPCLPVPSDLADCIPTFVPTPGPSDLHQRLRSVVQSGRPEP